MVSSRNYVCLKCGAWYGGKGNGHCTQWVNGKPCKGMLKRDDALTEEDYEQLRRGEIK